MSNEKACETQARRKGKGSCAPAHGAGLSGPLAAPERATVKGLLLRRARPKRPVPAYLKRGSRKLGVSGKKQRLPRNTVPETDTGPRMIIHSGGGRTMEKELGKMLSYLR